MKSVMFLRGNSFRNMTGYTDIEVALWLKDKYHISIVSRDTPIQSDSRYANVEIHPVPVHQVPFIGSLLFNILAFMTIRHMHYDALIVNPSLFLTAYLYKMNHPDSKIILDIRSVPIETNRWRSAIAHGLLYRIFSSRILSGITIITPEMLRDITQKFSVQCTVPIGYWSSGVNPVLFHRETSPIPPQKSIHDDRIILVHHGTLARIRGIDNLIIALKLLVDAEIDARLFLVGGGRDLSYFKDTVEKLHLQSHVVFYGLVPYEDVPRILEMADMAVIPFPKEEFFFSQSPIKIFECLAMALPIIATDLPAHRDISKNIILIRDNTPESIRDAVIGYYSLSIRERVALSEAAVIASAQYSWASQANILYGFLENNIFCSK